MLKKLFILFAWICLHFNAIALEGYEDGSRWAFVSDETSNKIAIIDTVEKTFVEHYDLKNIPQQVIVSDIKDILLYHDGATPTIFAIDLKNGNEWEIKLTNLPKEIIFYPDGSKIAVLSQNKITIIDPMTQEINEELENIANDVSINFSSDGYKLFITDKNTGETLIWSVYHKFSRNIALGNHQPVSDISLSANSLLALVSSDNQLIMYNRVEKQQYSPIILDGQLNRPYMSADSKNILVASDNGKAYVIKPWQPFAKYSVNIGAAPNIIRTGWLEKVGVISGYNQIDIFPIDDKGKNTTIKAEGYIKDMVVTTDSKSLFAVQSQSTKIKSINLRNHEVLDDIETHLTKPKQIIMGRTNTVCN